MIVALARTDCDYGLLEEENQRKVNSLAGHFPGEVLRAGPQPRGLQVRLGAQQEVQVHRLPRHQGSESYPRRKGSPVLFVRLHVPCGLHLQALLLGREDLRRPTRLDQRLQRPLRVQTQDQRKTKTTTSDSHHRESDFTIIATTKKARGRLCQQESTHALPE